MIAEHKRVQDSLDFMGAKLGLIPIEDIGKHRLPLSKQEKKEMVEIFKAASDRRYNEWKAAGFPGSADVSPEHHRKEELKDEKELNEARTEWKKRAEARKHSATSEASK